MIHPYVSGLRQYPEGRHIQQLDIKSNMIVGRFNSVCSAARSIRVAPPNIVACLKKRQKTAYGYKWKYDEWIIIFYTSSGSEEVLNTTPNLAIIYYRLIECNFSFLGEWGQWKVIT